MCSKQSTAKTLLAMLIAALASTAAAQNKFELNARAYTGIVFARLFGDGSDPMPRPVYEDPQQCPSTKSADPNAMTLGDFTKLLHANLQKYAPADDQDKLLVQDIIKRLDALNSFLDKSATPQYGCLATWPLRWFFNEDIKTAKYPTDDIQNAVQTLYNEHFLPLDKAGLTLPWLLVAVRGSYGELSDLFLDSRFLARTARMTYPDFFTIGMDNPLVDDELVNLIQRAIQVGLFGALHAYKAKPELNVTPQELAESNVISASYSCCSKYTRTCGGSVVFYHVCNTCLNYCCLGSTVCPSS